MPFINSEFPPDMVLYASIGSVRWYSHTVDVTEVYRDTSTWEKVLWERDVNYMSCELDSFLAGHNDIYESKDGTKYSVDNVLIEQDGEMTPLFWARIRGTE